jgi:hypothetical protein
MSPRKKVGRKRARRGDLVTPHGRFAAWFAASGLSKADVGRLLECTPEHVGYLLSRVRAPGLKLAFAIEEATAEWEHGPIAAKDWIDAETRPAA